MAVNLSYTELVLNLAHQTGWRTVQVLHSDTEILRLQRGTSLIPVHYGTGEVTQISKIHQCISTDDNYEHLVVCTNGSYSQLKRMLQDIQHKKVWLTSPPQLRAWLLNRGGPVNYTESTSPLRAFIEELSSGTPFGRQMAYADIHLTGHSSIKSSFDLGALGVQAISSLLHYTHGENKVKNVEGEKFWQALDVDLILHAPALEGLKIEIKCEDKLTGNIVLEHFGNYERGTKGWMHFSETDVLVTCLWLTGEVLVMDFKELKRWWAENNADNTLIQGRLPLRRVFGFASGQPYRSQVDLAPVDRLLRELKNIAYFSLYEWLPHLYPRNPGPPRSQLISNEFRYRRLSPRSNNLLQ